MGKNSGRNVGGSYSNPKSKARSRKEYEKKHSESTTNYPSSYGSKKNNTSNNKPYNEKRKVQTATMYGAHTDKNGNIVDNLTGKVYGKVNKNQTKSRPIKHKTENQEAKIIVATDNFNDLCIEFPVAMKPFHRLSDQSIKLISNFMEANKWCVALFNHKIIYQIANNYEIDMKKTLKSMIRGNFNKKRFYNDGGIASNGKVCRDVFFYKTIHPTTKKVQWFFCMNVSDLYDSYAADCKMRGECIPYQLPINHLIYKDIWKDVDTDATYPMNSRMAFVSSINGAKRPIEPFHKVKYVLYNNDKNKRKAIDKQNSDSNYIAHQFNKIVIKEIPVSTKH